MQKRLFLDQPLSNWQWSEISSDWDEVFKISQLICRLQAVELVSCYRPKIRSKEILPESKLVLKHHIFCFDLYIDMSSIDC